jgi:hypothetical protein
MPEVLFPLAHHAAVPALPFFGPMLLIVAFLLVTRLRSH